MKVRYQITMEVEVDFDPKTEHLSSLKLDLADYAKAGFIGRAYTRDNATVTKVKVSRIGACDNRKHKADNKKAGTSFNGFKKLGDKKVEPVDGAIFHKHDANLTTKAPEDYECGCGAMVEKGTELHACQKCQGWQCPNCFDYDEKLCEECISS